MSGRFASQPRSAAWNKVAEDGSSNPASVTRKSMRDLGARRHVDDVGVEHEPISRPAVGYVDDFFEGRAAGVLSGPSRAASAGPLSLVPVSAHVSSGVCVGGGPARVGARSHAYPADKIKKGSSKKRKNTETILERWVPRLRRLHRGLKNRGGVVRVALIERELADLENWYPLLFKTPSLNALHRVLEPHLEDAKDTSWERWLNMIGGGNTELFINVLSRRVFEAELLRPTQVRLKKQIQTTRRQLGRWLSGDLQIGLLHRYLRAAPTTQAEWLLKGLGLGRDVQSIFALNLDDPSSIEKLRSVLVERHRALGVLDITATTDLSRLVLESSEHLFAESLTDLFPEWVLDAHHRPKICNAFQEAIYVQLREYGALNDVLNLFSKWVDGHHPSLKALGRFRAWVLKESRYALDEIERPGSAPPEEYETLNRILIDLIKAYSIRRR